MLKRLWWLGLMLGCAGNCLAQIGAISGNAQLGGTKANVSGLQATNYQLGIVPSATVTVYLTGTMTLATIYANASSSPLSNPFTANNAASSNPGGYLFYASTSRCYDIVLSGGIVPNTFPVPVTLTGVCSGSAGGGGTVTSVSVATANGFSGTVANSTTNPLITISSSGLTGSYNPTNQFVTIAGGLVTAISPLFSMGISCTASGTFEIGYATTNPNICTLSYSNGTAASATVGDGTHTTTLSSPYTSGQLAFSYTSNTTFTGNATATNGQTASATQSFAVAYCTFSGLSTGGTATGATASGSATGGMCANETATLTGITGTLNSNGLGNTYAGESFTFSSPGGLYLSLLLTGGCGHTLTVGGFTTTFTTHALTYTNIEGGSQTGMCIYTSPSPASISTTVVVQSL